jgi:hypothetical protein
MTAHIAIATLPLPPVLRAGGLSEDEIGKALALARAWCRALRLDEVSAALRPLAPGPVPEPDPAALRRAGGLGPRASLASVLEELADRSRSAEVSERIARAAELAWELALP